MGRAFEVRKNAMAKTAAAKTKVNSKYGKEIYVAAKNGGAELDTNLSLKRLIEKAKKESKERLTLSKKIIYSVLTNVANPYMCNIFLIIYFLRIC